MDFYEFMMNGENFKSEKDIKFLNPLVMAFVGDSVYSLFVKTKNLDIFSKKVDRLTKATAEVVNAHAQQQALFKVMPRLTEEEQDIVRRARNASIHTKAKNYSIEEYRHATAFEALIGYLYLTKNEDRLVEILSILSEI